ncbi:MAG: energy transducer TonB [Saprospiraceae bacterium]|nr:energy transducer TonB [Lewinellaceae bacterium]
MKYTFPIALLLVLLNNAIIAQSADTTIYEVAERLPLPLLMSCQPERHPGWTEDSVRRCAEAQLLTIVAKNIRYPEEARQNNLEGTVVTSFVIEPTGRISGIKILKDIGGGCGPEAARVLQALDDAGLRWLPAMRDGKPVRMRQAMPLRFRLQEALPYFINATGDSIYVQVDSMPNFEGGEEGLLDFLLNGLHYPTAYRDSCKTGIIELALVIRPDGQVDIEDQLDFSGLGLDFQFEAIRLANRSAGKWIPAQYQGRPVATSVPVRMLFKSDRPGCKAANEAFDQAMLLSNEAAALSSNNEVEQALEKWNQALALHPDNSELLYFRASAFLSLDKREAACADFSKVKILMGTTWFEPLRRLVCGW